jgi:hypothetical protein
MHTACAEKSVHPLRFTLLNIAYGMRVENLQEVGYLPDLSAAVLATGIRADTPMFRVVKLHLLSKCLRVLLAPLKHASFEGGLHAPARSATMHARAHTRTHAHTLLPCTRARPTHPPHPNHPTPQA